MLAHTPGHTRLGQLRCCARRRLETNRGAGKPGRLLNPEKRETMTAPNAPASPLFIAGPGNDLLTGGPGFDFLNGLGGNDTILGNGGGDRLQGQAGDDVIFGGAGADTIFGGDGKDTVAGGSGQDLVYLGAGDDLFQWVAGDGADKINGGAGFDTAALTMSVAGETIGISATGSGARIAGDGRAAIEVQDVERINLQMLDGADKLVINDLTGSLVQEVTINLAGAAGGGDGAVDSITVKGTGGDDFIDLLGQPGQFFVLGTPAFVTVQNAEAIDTFTISGGAGDDRISAGSISAGAGKFTLDGGAGDDQILGTQGNDTLLGGAGDDFIDGGKGNDIAQLGSGDDIFIWESGDGSDTIEAGAGFDGIRFSGSSANETVELGAANGTVSFNTSAGGGSSVAMKDAELISLLSFGGADTFVINDLSGTQVEIVDISLFDFGVPGGNEDVVVVNGTSGADNIVITEENGVITITGLGQVIRITGFNPANDTLHINGLDGNDTIDATDLAGMDLQIDGGSGNDLMIGTAGADILIGGDGDDIILSGSGNDVAIGGLGDDGLFGDLGDDVLDGGAGTDILVGGGGVDVLLNGEVVLSVVPDAFFA